MSVKINKFKLLPVFLAAIFVSGSAPVQAQVHSPYSPTLRQAAAPTDSRARIGIVTEQMAKEGFRLLPGESYKAVREKMSVAIIAPAGHYAAVAVPDESCLNPTMAVDDRKAGQHFAAKPLGDALVAYLDPAKDTEVFMTMTSGDSRCFAYLLAFGR